MNCIPEEIYDRSNYYAASKEHFGTLSEPLDKSHFPRLDISHPVHICPLSFQATATI